MTGNGGMVVEVLAGQSAQPWSFTVRWIRAVRRMGMWVTLAARSDSISRLWIRQIPKQFAQQLTPTTPYIGVMP